VRVAAFDSGSKLSEIDAGFYFDRVRVGTLEPAPAVIDDLGHLALAERGSEVSMNPEVRAVRRNLSPIVDHGRPDGGLYGNSNRRCGRARSQLQLPLRARWVSIRQVV